MTTAAVIQRREDETLDQFWVRVQEYAKSLEPDQKSSPILIVAEENFLDE